MIYSPKVIMVASPTAAKAGIMTKRLAELRKLMSDYKVAAYIIPHQDAHNSEYISAADERIAFISNFDGSAGTCVVTHTQALLWTDGRYFNQATQQLPKEPAWELMKDRIPGTPKLSDFLANLGKDAVVGIDPLLTSVATYTDLSAKVTLASIEKNLVDSVWGSEQPIRSLAAVKGLAIEFSGQSRPHKLKAIREEMKNESPAGVTVCLVSALDEIAWTLNLRGSDIDYNPMFFSFLSIEKEKCVLFIDPIKMNPEITAKLAQDKIEVESYNGFVNYIKNLPSESRVWLDVDSANLAMYQAIPAKASKVEKPLPINMLKACKNDTEIAGSRACHIQDGVAEVRWLHWLSTEIMCDESKYRHHTEVTLAEKLEDFRKEGENFQGLSFGSISSFGANAAIIHYHARPASCAKADPTKIYLIDSGGQYLGGTTDVTRTVHFGSPSDAEKEAFTRVLQGVIQLSCVKFPTGTTGPALDVLARHSLWQAGLDYRHGTGHGVGSFLNVHEGPCGISPAIWGPRSQSLKTPLKVGMILSNEPGYYEDGNFGIRIENLMTVVESDTVFKLNKDTKMLTFETLTMIPIQKKMIQVDLLTDEEIDWLNDYHGTVLSNLAPLLGEYELAWLKNETSPIVRESKSPTVPSKRTRTGSKA